MSETPRLPEPRASQEIREILEKHRERTSNVTPVISIGESLMEHFNNFTRREIDDIRRQLEIVQPWFPISDEEEELRRLEGNFEMLRGKLGSLLTNAKQGKITNLENFDLDTIMDVFKMIDDVEKLWNKVQRWSLALLRQAELFRQWLQEMLPSET